MSAPKQNITYATAPMYSAVGSGSQPAAVQPGIPVAQPVKGQARPLPPSQPQPQVDIESRRLLSGPYEYNPNAGGSERWYGEADMEKQLRMGFVRKVYSLLFCQFAVTVGAICLFIYNEGVKSYVAENSWVMYTCLGLYLFTAITLICCGDMRRRHPHGLICLFLLTISLSVLVGAISASYDTETVLYAGISTVAVVFTLTLYACQTKYDFTMLRGVLFSFIMVFWVSCMILWLWPVRTAAEARTLNVVYAGIGAMVMCVFIVYDTQLMLGGRHKLSFALDEYVFAALNIYLDVINLFLYLLQIIGGGKR